MEVIWQGITNGLMMGWIYVLVALGMTIVFGIMRIVQLAHGEIYMLGAYAVYYFAVVYGMNIFLAFATSAVLLAAVGIILERVLFRRFRGRVESSMIVSIGLILLLQTAVVVISSTEEKSIPKIIPGVLIFFGIRMAWDRVLAVVTGIVLLLLLFAFIRKTRVGQAMVAVSEDADGAALQGIDVNRISSLAMAIGCAFAAVAGGLMGAIFKVEPFMGGFALGKGIAVVILGGLGSIWGSVIGGLILGLIDGIVPLYVNTTVSAIIGCLVVILLLVIRPQGLMGHD